jgi:hypothetical protein
MKNTKNKKQNKTKETPYKQIKKMISGGVSIKLLNQAQELCDLALADFLITKRDAGRLYAEIGCRRAGLYRLFGFMSTNGIITSRS